MVEAQEPPEARRSRQPDLAAESSNSGNTTGGHGLPAVVVSLSITGSGAAPGPLLLDKSPLQQLPQQAEVESQVRLQAQGSTPPTSWSRAVLHGQQNQAHAHQQQLPDQNLDDHQHPQPRPEEVDLETLAPTPLQGANEPGVIAKEGYEVIKRPVDVTIPSSTISTPPTSSHTILPTTITTSTTTIFSSATVSASRTTTTATATPATTEGSTAAGDNTSSSRSSSRSGSSGSSSGGGGSKSSASGSTTTTTLTPTTTVTTEPFISTLRDGLTTVRRDQQHNRCAPLSLSSANMSNPPQHPSHTRPPLGFPSPPYASPPQGLGGHSHYGYGNPLPPGPDQYRPGPPTPVGSNNPLSLPSMRTFDTLQHQQAQQSPMAAQMMQVQAGMSYYPQPVPVPGNPNPYSLPPEAMAQRYPLPPNDPRVMLGGPPRNKKEIKRRTKTGCLTCRKRRIKCDEQHPVCKNCQKSKRECLGYDPIFKQQQQHPTNIQPAPNHPVPSAAVPSNGPPPAASPIHPPVPAATAASSVSILSNVGTYTSLPSVLPNSHPSGGSSTSSSAGNTLTPVPSTAPSVKGENFDYGAAIDPALDSVGTTSSTSASYPSTAPAPPTSNSFHYRGTSSGIGGPSLRGGGLPSPLYQHPSPPLPAQHLQPQSPAYSIVPAKKMRIAELLSLGGVTPQKLEAPPTKETLDEIRSLYFEIYAPALDSFFESRWYSRDVAVNTLLGHKSAVDVLAGFLGVVGKANVTDTATMNYSANLEFFVVWELTCLPYAPGAIANAAESSFAPEDDPTQTRGRIIVFDTLVAGDYLDQNPVQPPLASSDPRYREYDFWYSLGEFLRIREHPGGVDLTPQREQLLGRIRALLDGRENRDLLYSIAVTRSLAPNFPPSFENALPAHLDESDPKNKLAVAKKFIQDEAKVTGGTTNIVRRFSELAARAFITPGCNVPRRGPSSS